MLPRAPLPVEAPTDAQVECSDMGPPWPGPSSFLEPSDTRLGVSSSPAQDRICSSVHPCGGHSRVPDHAEGASAFESVEGTEPTSHPQGQLPPCEIFFGYAGRDNGSSQKEQDFFSPQHRLPQNQILTATSIATTTTNGSDSPAPIFPDASFFGSGQQLFSDLFSHIGDSTFSASISLNPATTVQQFELDSNQVEDVSDILNPTFSPLCFPGLETQNLEPATDTPNTLPQSDSVSHPISADTPTSLVALPAPATTGASSLTAAQTKHPVTADAPLHVIRYDQGGRVGRKRDTTRDQRIQACSSNQVAKKRRAVRRRVDVLRSETEPKAVAMKDSDGRIVGGCITFGLDQVVRVQPAARSLVACQRCRHDKVACVAPEDEYSLCARCKMFWLRNFFDRRHLKKGTFQYQPCLKFEVIGLKLHRLGPTKYDTLETWVRRKQQLLPSFPPETTQYLFLTQGFGESINDSLCLKVSPFNPVDPEDRTAYFWTDRQGRLRRHEMPPYFISDLEYATTGIRMFLRDNRDTYIDRLLGPGSRLIHQTFDVARSFCTRKKSTLLSAALDIWVSARFIEDHWKIFCGGHLIGATITDEPDEPGHPYNGYIPVTPIMDTQLDDLVIRVLIKPRLEAFLILLKRKLDEKKRENWFELFLAKFIMMSNIGWVIKDMITMTTWKGLKPGNRGGTLTQGYIHACKTMLSHFHFGYAGSIPLTKNFVPNKEHLGLEPHEFEYVKFVRQEILDQEAKLAGWKDLSMYKDDAYWVYQLLCHDWTGDHKHPVEIDDFTEDDFLSSSST